MILSSIKRAVIGFFDDTVLAQSFSSDKRVQQVKLMLKIVGLAWVALFATNFVANSLSVLTLSLAGLSVFTCFLYLYVDEDTYVISAGMFLWGATVAVTHFAWKNGGLWDEALFAYPCILTISIIFNMQIIFLTILVFNIASIIFFAYMHSAGILQAGILGTDSIFGRATNFVILLLVFSFCLQIIYSDFKLLLIKLLRESEKAGMVSEEVARLASTDHVTRLNNEQIFQKEFIALREHSVDSSQLYSIIVVQVGSYELLPLSIEERLADSIFQQLGMRMASFVDPHVKLYFFRGQKFVIFVRKDNYREIESLAERLLFAVTSPLDAFNYHVELKAHCGFVVFPMTQELAGDLVVQKASLAANKAMRSKSSQPMLYLDEMGKSAENRRLLLQSLNGAVLRGELELHYQPKVNLISGDIVGAEALLRWRKPGVGMISPDVFIPLAEESGAIVEIGQWVLEEACRACRRFHLQGYNRLNIAINLSIYQFRKGDLPFTVFRCLEEANITPDAIELEITESMLSEDIANIQAQIRTLSAKGVQFSIDDFGTGYSNLGYISKFNVSYLKIDKSFVSAMLRSPEDFQIVKAITQMARGLNMITIAEGVEYAEEVTALIEMGCQYGQGYYWSKPLDETAFSCLLKQENIERSAG